MFASTKTLRVPRRDDHGINRAGGPYIAWFKDPAGDILRCCRSAKTARWPNRGLVPEGARRWRRG